MTDDNKVSRIASGYFFDGLSALPEKTTVTMAYVPFQTDINMYGESEALCNGTLFKSLNKPFLRGGLK